MAAFVPFTCLKCLSTESLGKAKAGLSTGAAAKQGKGHSHLRAEKRYSHFRAGKACSHWRAGSAMVISLMSPRKWLITAVTGDTWNSGLHAKTL